LKTTVAKLGRGPRRENGPAFSSLPGLTRQSMRQVGSLKSAVRFRLLHFSMDHRVKPGGDEGGGGCSQGRMSMSKKAKSMTPERYAARFKAEKARLQRHYCTHFKFWRACPFQPCRKSRACVGDQKTCLKRHVEQV
jgi:hypothetical protein